VRRRFFLFAAPAIVAAPSLMRVSTLFMPKETLHELLARRIKSAEVAMRADLERAMDEMWEYGNSDPNFGLAALLREDAPVVGGIARSTFQWWDASVSISLETA
jgi:hypothetical protein